MAVVKSAAKLTRCNSASIRRNDIKPSHADIAPSAQSHRLFWAASAFRTVILPLKLTAALFDQVTQSFTVCRTELRSAWLSDCRSFPVAANESVNTANLEEFAFEPNWASGSFGCMVWVDKRDAPFCDPADRHSPLPQPCLEVGIAGDFLARDGRCNRVGHDLLEFSHVGREPMAIRPNGASRFKVLRGRIAIGLILQFLPQFDTSPINGVVVRLQALARRNVHVCNDDVRGAA